MAKFKNSFALLDNEEEDDVTTLVDRIVQKVDNTSMHAQNWTQSSDFVQEGSGRRRGGQGRREGSRGNGYGWDDDIQGGDGWDGDRRNYSRDSYGSGDIIKDDGGWDGDSRGHGRGLDGENGWHNVNEADGGDICQIDNHEPGWQNVSKSNVRKYAIRGRSSEDGNRRIGNGNQSYSGGRRGYGDEVHDNGAADGQRRYRNGNQRNDGKRRGYGDQAHNNNDAADGRRRSRNGNWSDDEGEKTAHGDQVQNIDAAADGQRRFRNGSWGGNGYQVQNNDAGSEQLDVNGEINENNNFKDEERTYRKRNRNSGGERRGYGGYRGKGRQEYQRTVNGEVKVTTDADDGLDVKAENVNGSEGDGAVVLEALKAAETEEKNTFEEVNGGDRNPEKADLLKKKELEKKKEEDKKKEELEKKKEEDKEAALLTLAEYEKLLLEKRQALESLKTEERRVALDKELEGMRLIEKKQDDTDDKQKSEVKLKKKGSLENKEKGRKLVGLEVHEIFKPAFRRWSNGVRGEGRGGRGRGDQGGFSGQTNNYHGPRTYGDARARQRAPTDKDFPVLGTNSPAPVKP